jgi:2-polyprenylphenol hydroxylase and related flavodoxin oxidoreductases
MEKKNLAPQIYLMKVKAPRVAGSAKPGQFVIVREGEQDERIPLTICDYDENTGEVTIVFQSVGHSTKAMAVLNEGDSFLNFAGPLGNPSDFVNEDIEKLKSEKIIFIAGGVGAAPVYPQVKYLHEHGIDADVIVGSKSKEYLILEDEMKKVAGNLYITTDDGSYGYKGLVTNLLKDLVEKEGRKYDKVIAIGPMIMMKFVCKLTKELGIPTIVSLNSIMVDGTGMCGACRVTVGGKTKFTCVEGPEFDGHLVDFEEAMRRQMIYKSEEAVEIHRKNSVKEPGCFCNVELEGGI